MNPGTNVTPCRTMSRAPARRPTLLPAIRRLWRDTHRLQLGTDPGRAVVLEFADPGCARLLDLLDGKHTEAALLRAAVRYGIRTPDAAAILAALRQAGFVVDASSLQAVAPEATRRRLDGEAAALALPGPGPCPAPNAATTIRKRLNAQVLVTGSSHLAVPIAATLASAGVGQVM